MGMGLEGGGWITNRCVPGAIRDRAWNLVHWGDEGGGGVVRLARTRMRGSAAFAAAAAGGGCGRSRFKSRFMATGIGVGSEKLPVLMWTDDLGGKCKESYQAELRSSRLSFPNLDKKSAVAVDENVGADRCMAMIRSGSYLVWKGSTFHNASILLASLSRRAKRRAQRAPEGASLKQRFLMERSNRSALLQVQDALQLHFEENYLLRVPRSPSNLADACEAAFGPRESARPFLISLQHLRGVVGACELLKAGVHVPALSDKVYPHYGVFSPVRGEYIDLIAQELTRGTHIPLTGRNQGNLRAIDVGTGTGVVSALLLRTGAFGHVSATDISPRAIECASENLSRMGLLPRVTLTLCDMFPGEESNQFESKSSESDGVPITAGDGVSTGVAGSGELDEGADLILVNPPWIGPAKPHSILDLSVYDENCSFLKRVLFSCRSRLKPDGQVWLVISDLSERLGLRSRDDLKSWISAGGLKIVGESSTSPAHAKTRDETDPLHEARSNEVTTLFRLIACSLNLP